MSDTNNSFKNRNFLLIISSIIIIGILLTFAHFLYISNLETKIINHKKRQLEYINKKNNIIPKSIKYINGWLIGDIEAIKHLLKINILTKSETNKNENLIYNNEMQKIVIMNDLMNIAEKNLYLKHDRIFKELNEKFKRFYRLSMHSFNECKKLSNKLLHYSPKSKYKDIKNLICTDENLKFKVPETIEAKNGIQQRKYLL